jgi:hypothetical protein
MEERSLELSIIIVSATEKVCRYLKPVAQKLSETSTCYVTFFQLLESMSVEKHVLDTSAREQLS